MYGLNIGLDTHLEDTIRVLSMIEAKRGVEGTKRPYKGFRFPGKSYPFSSTRQIERNRRQFEAGQIKFISRPTA